MIRVAVLSAEALPASLIRLLETSGEVQLVQDRALPDLLLLYITVWNRNALARYAPLSHPALVLCSRAEEPFATESVLRNDVSGVLLASSSSEQILTAMSAAAAGLRLLPNKTAAAGRFVESAPLTPREIEILRLIADGEGNKTIAQLLEISQHTVKFHISSIFQKLRVSSRTEAVKAGITGGLIAL